MKRLWTDAQRQAILSGDGEFVVSASAGTGKTSLIIERVLYLIRSRKADIDRILILTFTEDAAEELKSRLLDEFQASVEHAEDDSIKAFWQEQIDKLAASQISTVHSFCLRILQENRHHLGLPDTLEILSAERASLVKHKIVDELFEWAYADYGLDSTFRDLIVMYGGRGVDEGLKETIISLHDFWQSLAYPEEWIGQVKRSFEGVCSSEEDKRKTKQIVYSVISCFWIPRLYLLYERLTGLKERHISDLPQGIIEHIDGIKDIVKETIVALSKGVLPGIDSLPRTPSCRDAEKKVLYDKELSSVKRELKQILKDIKAVSDDPRLFPSEQIPYLRMILDLAEQFSSRLLEYKRKEGLLEYDDLQRFAFMLLVDSRTGVADRLKDRYEYVLVDEYQDINDLQDKIIRLVCRNLPLTGRLNLFMVGDLKQSIYRFRLAEPRIFQEIVSAASAMGEGVSKVELKKNFRSRREVIDTVNTIFKRLMKEKVFEVEYDDSHRLECSGRFPDDGKEGLYATELHIFDKPSKERSSVDSEESVSNANQNSLEEEDIADITAQEVESEFVAGYIEKLLKDGFAVYEGGKKRKIKPSDIVILLRTLKNNAFYYIKALRARNIPVVADQVETFLELPEIRDIVSLLKVIYNPYQDIPLVAVLRSPLVGLSPSELVDVRREDSRSFYNALTSYARKSGNERICEFLERLSYWRSIANRVSVFELVSKIYAQTGYPDYAGLDDFSRFAAQNLEQLLMLAASFGESATLKEFLDSLELIQEREFVISGLSAASSEGVRIMSIHAAKGLEFPFVILAGLGRRFNLRDSSGSYIVFDRELGLAASVGDPLNKGGKPVEPFLFRAIKARKSMQLKAEEMRLLYVAMTRAKEKLILVGSADLEDLLSYRHILASEEEMLQYIALGSSSFLEWVILALEAEAPNLADRILQICKDLAEEKIGTSGPVSLQLSSGSSFMDIYIHSFGAHVDAYVGSWDSAYKGASGDYSTDRKKESTLNSGVLPGPVEIIEDIERTFLAEKANIFAEKCDWSYPDIALSLTPAKISVTEFVKQRFYTAEQDAVGDGPDMDMIHCDLDFRILDDESIKEIEKGLVWHKLMEHIRLDVPGNSIDEEFVGYEIDRLILAGLITAEQSKSIDARKVVSFFSSYPGRLLLEYPQQVFREYEFSYLIPADALPDRLKIEASKEPVLVHGIVDCLLVLEKGLVIIDYKTSNITASEVDEKVGLYRFQLELYARGLSDILKRSVLEAWLYFTEPSSAVRVL